jgi:hypothetical protein
MIWGRSTGKSFVAAALAAALFSAALPPAAVAADDPYRQTSLALGQGLVALFPAVEGYVVSASGREVYVDLAEKDLLKPGMELQVYRPGEAMVHPVTRQVLGSYEKALGILRIAEVREKYSRGVLADEGTGIAPGDRVRVSARRLRALLHFAGDFPAAAVGPFAQALVARAEESTRFTMIDEPSWAAALAALGKPVDVALGDPAALRALGEQAPADILLAVRLLAAEGRPAVAMTVHSLRTGAVLGELREPWPQGPGATPPAPPARTSTLPAPVPAPAPAAAAAPVAAPPPAPSEERDYVIRELPAAARCLALGDIVGEGKVDLLFSDGGGLALYRWDPKELVWKWAEDGPADRKVIALDAADLDGDGKVEVLVATARRGSVRTEVRGWRNGRLEVLGAADGIYLRAFRRDGGGALLLGQRAGVGEVLAGTVEEYRWRGGAVERAGGPPLPRQAGIFGLAPAGAALFALDRNGYIQSLAPDGKRLWRSGSLYGGYPAPAKPRELFGPGFVDEAAFEEEVRAFQGRMLAEASAEGFRVTVPRNGLGSPVVMTRHRELGQGQVVVLEGSATNLEEVRASRAFDGYVADLASVDLDGDGKREVLFVVNRASGLLGDRGRLVVWRVPAR